MLKSIKENFSDKNYCIGVVSAAILLFSNLYHYFDSGFMVQPLVRVVCSSLFLIVSLLTGKRLWSYLIFMWAMSILYFNRFYNFTSWVMVLVSVFLNRKMKAPFITAYIIATGVCVWLYDDNFAHLLIHSTGCFVCFLVEEGLWKKVSDIRWAPLQLDLTPQEKRILDCLANGKQQKEIDFVNKNTVTKYLNNAKQRNCCSTTGELLAKYKQYNS